MLVRLFVKSISAHLRCHTKVHAIGAYFSERTETSISVQHFEATCSSCNDR